MAKFTPGPTVAAVSGSIGGTTYSRNRYGAYMRYRAIPTTPTSYWFQKQTEWVIEFSQLWQSRTVAEKAAWRNWAQTHPQVDALGNPQVLTGHAAYVSLNCRLRKCEGTLTLVPPVIPPPPALLTVALTADIGAGAVEIAFTPTPCPAQTALWLYAAVVESQGIAYVKNLLRCLETAVLGMISPVNIQTAVEDRFGALQVGHTLHVRLAQINYVNGQISAFKSATQIVVST